MLPGLLLDGERLGVLSSVNEFGGGKRMPGSSSAGRGRLLPVSALSSKELYEPVGDGRGCSYGGLTAE